MTENWKGMLSLRDNPDVCLQFQYFPETIKVRRNRSIDERPLPLRSTPVNFDASAAAPVVSFTAMFNSFYEDRQHSPIYWQNVIQGGINTVPQDAIGRLVQLWRPEMYGTDHVWLLDLGFPVAPREVLIESWEEKHEFYEAQSKLSRRMVYDVTVRYYYELKDPERRYTAPSITIRKQAPICPEPDVEALESALGISLSPQQRKKVLGLFQP